jgi:hypothetical protein
MNDVVLQDDEKVVGFKMWHDGNVCYGFAIKVATKARKVLSGEVNPFQAILREIDVSTIAPTDCNNFNEKHEPSREDASTLEKQLHLDLAADLCYDIATLKLQQKYGFVEVTEG